MQLTFRIDDVTPTMNWDWFYQTLKMLRKYNVKPILGVIPSCKDEKLLEYFENPTFWRDLKKYQEEGYIIALHGYEHRYVTTNAGIFPVNDYSEFAGLSYEEQFEKIRKGKQILSDHGLHTDMFMAPAHSFDKNTCKALLENKIHYITDGFGKSCYKRYGLVFLPIALTWRRALQLNNWETCTIVLHTNSMTDQLIYKYEVICKEHLDSLFSWDDVALSQIDIGKYNEKYQEGELRVYRIFSELSKMRKFIRKNIPKNRLEKRVLSNRMEIK